MGLYPGGNIIRVTPTLDTNAYAADDVLFNPTKIPGAVSNRGGVSLLKAMYVLDQADIADSDIKFIFTEGSTDLGTINATANISDADLKANNICSYAFLDASEAGTGATIDNSRIYPVFPSSGSGETGGPEVMLKAADGSTDVYVSAVLTSSTTPTYAASDLQLIFNIIYL